MSCTCCDVTELPTKECQLCTGDVPVPEWRLHKKTCGAGLEELKQLEGFNCPACHIRKLKQIPVRVANNRFKCQSKDYLSRRWSRCHMHDLVNTNKNRFSCFHCDVDLCLDCISEAQYGGDRNLALDDVKPPYKQVRYIKLVKSRERHWRRRPYYHIYKNGEEPAEPEVESAPEQDQETNNNSVSLEEEPNEEEEYYE